MFDKLIDFILKTINHALPFAVVYEFQNGLRYRFGKAGSILKPGIHYKIPYVDTITSDCVVDTTMLLQAQSLLTIDGKRVVVKGTIGYCITNIKDYYTKIWDARSAIADKACLIIRELICYRSFEEIYTLSEKINEDFCNLISEFSEQYGIHVNFAGLIDASDSHSLRLYNEITNTYVNQ